MTKTQDKNYTSSLNGIKLSDNQQAVYKFGQNSFKDIIQIIIQSKQLVNGMQLLKL